ncbi:MAG: hypothetical protein NC489_15895 [Ruminococcus flavefaciens]|nr:hypothetical protein [Ruminococcus flavefaciens]
MTDIIEKDGATIITIENPTAEERKLINQAKNVMNNDENRSSELSGIWGKFKCNQKRTEQQDRLPAAEGNGGFMEILSFDELPF